MTSATENVIGSLRIKLETIYVKENKHCCSTESQIDVYDVNERTQNIVGGILNEIIGLEERNDF